MATTKTRTPNVTHYSPGYGYSYADIMRHPGHVFFVQSTHASAVDNVGHGRSPDLPCATLEYAMSLCTASAGDIVYLLPGHIEIVTAAAPLNLDVIGVTIRGCGSGTLQPIIRFTTAVGAVCNVTAASITVENVNWQAGFADITAAILPICTDFTIRRCRFTEQTAALNCLIWIREPADATAARITVEDCLIYAFDTANTHFINYAGTGSGHIFRRNVLMGDWGTMAVGGAGIILDAEISNNYIYNLANTANGCLLFAATATGVMARNMVGNSAAASSQITATGMSKNFNYAVDIGGADVQGIPEPAMA